MSLIDELKKRHERLSAEINALRAKRDEIQQATNALWLEREDVERAVGALQPPPPEAPVDESSSQETVTEAADGWESIAENVETITIKRDTEFMCSDGQIRQRRVNGEIGFLECDVATYSWWMNEPKKLSYRFTHMRDWKPQLEWAPYYGLTPPTHHGYRLETRIGEGGQNEYRYIPTDQFIPHEGDDICLADMDHEELKETLGSVGLALRDKS